MLLTWGVIISAAFAFAYNPGGRNHFHAGALNEDFFIVLGCVLVAGFAWDVAWILVQRLRWDRDWPPAFQWAAAIVEGAFTWLLLSNGVLPFIPAAESPPGRVFVLHYGLIFLVTFCFVQGPMRALYPRWRYYGGRLV
jgi:hypothetical protein